MLKKYISKILQLGEIDFEVIPFTHSIEILRMDPFACCVNYNGVGSGEASERIRIAFSGSRDIVN